MEYKAHLFNSLNNPVKYPHFTAKETKAKREQLQCPPVSKLYS